MDVTAPQPRAVDIQHVRHAATVVVMRIVERIEQVTVHINDSCRRATCYLSLKDPTTALHQKYHDGTLQCLGFRRKQKNGQVLFKPYCIFLQESHTRKSGTLERMKPRYTMDNMEWVEQRGHPNHKLCAPTSVHSCAFTCFCLRPTTEAFRLHLGELGRAYHIQLPDGFSCKASAKTTTCQSSRNLAAETTDEKVLTQVLSLRARVRPSDFV